jgi:hypothetical protein
MELYDLTWEEGIDFLLPFTVPSQKSDDDFADYLISQLQDSKERAASLPFFNERVLEGFAGPLDYFGTRGISPEVAEEHKLCYSEQVCKSAPIKRTRDGGIVKEDADYHGPAAIFPHFWQGKLVGWQYRWMDWDADHTKTPRWLSKYTNTSDFPKRDTLFNYDYALKSKHAVVVCESIPTVLFLQSCDIPAVSYFGGEISDIQLRLLRLFQQGVILAPDNDSPGEVLLAKATQYLIRFVPVYWVDKVGTKPGADLGDFAPDRGALYEHLTHYKTLISGIDF